MKKASALSAMHIQIARKTSKEKREGRLAGGQAARVIEGHAATGVSDELFARIIDAALSPRRIFAAIAIMERER